ncbi:MAG TPA: YbjQ family protein [Bdellovibrionota bacterium]|nr:YbjQ family protein [Bdellovibrionota bacterium]
MILTTIDSVPGMHIVEHFGTVNGSTVRTKHIGVVMVAWIKSFFGGELRGYTKLLQETHAQALERMVQQAESLGANAVVSVRFATSSIAHGAAELFAYGTAVRVE